jgi:hypothetical protein
MHRHIIQPVSSSADRYEEDTASFERYSAMAPPLDDPRFRWTQSADVVGLWQREASICELFVFLGHCQYHDCQWSKL